MHPISSTSSGRLAAVCLNNIAVELLEQQKFRQAVSIMHEALATIRATACCSSNNGMDSDAPESVLAESTKIIKHRINKAKDKIEQQQQQQQQETWTSRREEKRTYKGNHPQSMELENIRSMIVDGMPLSYLQDAVPIRIEDPNLNNNVDIESIIMLYNFGIAQLHLWESRKSVNNAKSREKACRLFQTAFSYIAFDFAKSKIVPEQLKPEDEEKLLLSILLLRNISRLQLEQGERTKASKSMHQLLFFRSVLIERSVCTETIDLLSPAA